MKGQGRNGCWAALAAVGIGFFTGAGALPLDINDSAGDTTGLDLTRLVYNVSGNGVEIRLTFAQDLEGAFGDINGIVHIDLDMDRSLLTGFISDGQWHPRCGIDYRIEIAHSGFGAAYDTAFLLYWQHHYDPPFITVEKQQVALGDFMFPNGSVLAVGTDWTYGTDSHQIYARIPLALFNNAAFPICGDTAFCYNTIYPCPLALTPDPRSALLSVSTQPIIPISVGASLDFLPDQGMLDAASGSVLPPFPTGTQDLVAQTTDPAGDALGGTALNGEDITAFKVFRHADDTFTFDLQLAGVNMANTTVYHLVFDLDDNPATGESFNQGVSLGVDLIALFVIVDNQVNSPNALEGHLKVWLGNGFCDLPDLDCLGTLTYSSPGHVAISLPRYLLAPYLAANTSGLMKVFAGTSANNVLFTGFDDVAPDTGVFAIPLGSSTPSTLRITAFEQRSRSVFYLRCVNGGAPLSGLAVESAPRTTGPWSRESAVLSPVGGAYETTLTSSASPGACFFRVVSTP